MVASALARLAEAAKRAAPSPRARKAALELTDAAVERIKVLLEKRGKVRPPAARRRRILLHRTRYSTARARRALPLTPNA